MKHKPFPREFSVSCESPGFNSLFIRLNNMRLVEEKLKNLEKNEVRKSIVTYRQ